MRGRLEDSSEEEEKGRAQLVVLDISRTEAALEKGLGKGWFSSQHELETGENIRQKKLEISATRDQYMRTREGFLTVV